MDRSLTSSLAVIALIFGAIYAFGALSEKFPALRELTRAIRGG